MPEAESPGSTGRDSIDPAWSACRRILCFRADNLGDLLMSSPAISSLKKSLGTEITVLCSSQAAGLLPFLPDIDDHILVDLPWVKLNEPRNSDRLHRIINRLSAGNFDACIIFTVYSQSPLPAALMLYLAGIPLVLAYCRENPYTLISHWVPDPEPYNLIRNQVRRDLDLLKVIGIQSEYKALHLTDYDRAWPETAALLREEGIDPDLPYLIFHIGVSEEKRKPGPQFWIEAAKLLATKQGLQLIITGLEADRMLAEKICSEAIKGLTRGNAGVNERGRTCPSAQCIIQPATIVSLAGKADFPEFISLISHARLIVSVNTSAIHLAAALDKVQVVLYALTNPQHIPWKGRGLLIPFQIEDAMRSRNEVIRHTDKGFPATCLLPDTCLFTGQLIGLLDNSLAPEIFPEVLEFPG